MRPGDGRVIPAFCTVRATRPAADIRGRRADAQLLLLRSTISSNAGRPARNRDGLAGTVVNLGKPARSVFANSRSS